MVAPPSSLTTGPGLPMATTGQPSYSLKSDHDRAHGGDRRRGPDGDDAGGRAGFGARRRRHRRAARQPGARRLARRRAARTHHRGARSAWNRGALPLAGAGHAGRALRDGASRHQRLSDAPQLRARALAEPDRAHPRRLGRRAGGHDLSRTRGDGLRAGRNRRRRRAVRRPCVAGAVPRRMRRRSQPGPQESRDRLPRLGSVGQLLDRRGSR